MLNSIEQEILNAHKYKSIKKFSFFLGSDMHWMLFFPTINVKMPTFVGILTFMSRKIFMLSWVEHEKSFIISGPGYIFYAPFDAHASSLPHFAYIRLFAKCIWIPFTCTVDVQIQNLQNVAEYI